MTAQPLPRETSIELVADNPVRRTRSKAATQTTAKKATAKTATKTTTKSTASKTVAKTATTRQRSATKSVAIVESSLQATVQTSSKSAIQTVPPTHSVTADSCLDDLHHCQQFFFNDILAESQKLTQNMAELASIALKIQQLKRPSFEPIPLITLRQCTKSSPVQTVAQPPSKSVFASKLESIADPIVQPIVEPTAQATAHSTAGTAVGTNAETPVGIPAKAQRPSRTSLSRLTVRKPIPPYDPSSHRSIEPSRSTAVAPNYWGGNVQAPVTATGSAAKASAQASQMRHDRLDLPKFDRPAQPVLQRLAQQQSHLTLAVQPTRPSNSTIQSLTQSRSQSQSFTGVTIYRDIYQHIQRLVPIPTEPKAIVVDAVLWTFSSVGVHVILQVCIQTVPLLSFPLHFVMLFPALFAAYLAFCVPKSSTPPVYRCLLTTLGFFLGSKL